MIVLIYFINIFKTQVVCCLTYFGVLCKSACYQVSIAKFNLQKRKSRQWPKYRQGQKWPHLSPLEAEFQILSLTWANLRKANSFDAQPSKLEPLFSPS